MSDRPILGIDPGLSGAWALLWADNRITAGDMPLAGGEIDCAALRQMIHAADPFVALVEDVHAMPGQGVTSMFRFGQADGMVKATITGLAVPRHKVAPTSWKKHFRLGKDKEEARALAIRLWPSAGCFTRKKDHGRAEAALIARYAAEKGLR